MKNSILYAAFSLSALAAAQPHGRHHHQHVKREVVHETVIVTATVPNVIVYVDQNGVPFATSYADVPAPTEAPAAPAHVPEAEPSNAPVIAAEVPKPSEAAPVPASSAPAPAAPPAETAPAPAPAPESSAAPAPAPSAAASSGEELGGFGISYAPYADDGNCKTQDQVSRDVTQMKGYNVIRVYGTDCDQIPKLLKAPKPSGVKLFLGIWDIAQVEKEAQIIIDAVAGDWNKIDTISVGNELVNKGAAAPGAVVAAVNAARTKLRSAGYGGPVVTVDTFNAIMANPELCGASDYAAANCHAFFDPNTEASQAGDFVLGMAQKVSQACGGKRTVITETGWPSQGSANSKAVPGVAQHMAAIDSIKSKFSSNVIFFSAFNDGWKKDFAGSFGAEKFWGMIQ